MKVVLLSRIAAMAFTLAALVWQPAVEARPQDRDRICGRQKSNFYFSARLRRLSHIENCKEVRGGSCPTWRLEDFRELQIDEQVICNYQYYECQINCPF
ncbi:MAG: hypothetical protein P8M30_19950 [Planctomycetaceae bacterium]|jgi:hypothetical protein|nr:hypothetical protein [Planctomycetaceae bacterium]MDB4786497.1 hypothetical protein [Planctomycetaceae bacterium]MDG2391586.1 hypothetical protein [Planctomycetaceae bacterium]